MSGESSELRRRLGDVASSESDPTRSVGKDHPDGQDSQAHSDDEDHVLEEEKMEDLTNYIPQATDKTTESLDSALSGLSARWRNWVVRGIFSIAMILSFGLIVYLGPLAVMLLVLAIQIKCFKELIDIGYAVYRVHNLPWFRTLSWYFLIASEYFFLGESMIDYFRVLLRKTEFLTFMVKYHRFISFSAYIAGFVWFVLSLKKSYYMRQFSLFAWTHVTLLIVVAQSYLIIQNIFQGMIWFLVPVSMIICNDIMAYIFGFFFGRTPLIKLSPKKTWEGFIGGAISTVAFGVALSYFLLHYPRFVCPIEFYDENRSFVNCDIPFSFVIHEYQLPKLFGSVLKVLRISPVIKLYPFIIDTVVLALFVSLVGPFGGFFASGFKRAFKIKDFGDVIPGHGGLMDRFDCQLLMGTFVNVYTYSFIRGPNPASLVRQILLLRPDEQLSVFTLLKDKLEISGLLNDTLAALT